MPQELELNVESDTSSPRKEEWRRPVLRKLPIAATAAGGTFQDDGHSGNKGQQNMGATS